jgi:hypothetical protein
LEWATGIEPASFGLEDRHSAVRVSLTKPENLDASGKIRTFIAQFAPQFYRLRAVPVGDWCEKIENINKSKIQNLKSKIEMVREIPKKMCKNEKGRDFAQSSDAKMHRMLRDCHLSELAKVFNEDANLPQSLCLFLCFAFKPRNLLFEHLKSLNQNQFRLFNCQTS